ncbi:tetratricopeptide repeat protein [Flagellimonas sp.]|uniref:tetratricopeptide repeat protein n=1 Tax=Flagellimonas sp. TaxID=2058762 RepID=UPI003B5A3301
MIWLRKNITFFVFGLLLANFQITAQEEEQSAEVFLEEYTDEFQESFFEALKQKGIQNYDRAIDLFLDCKNLDPLNSVVDYELGKAYFLDKQYVQAQEYAIKALLTEPTDFWYLESLVNILEKQGSSVNIIQRSIPFEDRKLQENLAVIYFKKKKYQDALKVLNGLGNSKFASDLSLKINDSLQKRNEKVTPAVVKDLPKEEDPVMQYKNRIEDLLGKSDYGQMEMVSKEALDTYPLQPYFYFAYGTALNRKSKPAKAVEVLESALDYLLDDDVLANKIYKELSKACTAIGNTSKAQEYLNKVKPGL